jgi:hypothetical protein
MNGWMEARAGKRSRGFFSVLERARKRVWGFARGEEDGVRATGKLLVAGDVAYLLCAASLHHADRMANERRRCHCRDDEKKQHGEIG